MAWKPGGRVGPDGEPEFVGVKKLLNDLERKMGKEDEEKITDAIQNERQCITTKMLNTLS
jgi:hypothetical protein